MVAGIAAVGEEAWSRKTAPCPKFVVYNWVEETNQPQQIMEIIAFQPALRPALPTVYSNSEIELERALNHYGKRA